jgi:hypothetical protein
MVTIGIARVVKEAWDAVSHDTAPEERFKTARRNAENSISRLSPYIKREVRAHLSAENWATLKSVDPDLK